MGIPINLNVFLAASNPCVAQSAAYFPFTIVLMKPSSKNKSILKEINSYA
jgi:hypothetical protein